MIFLKAAIDYKTLKRFSGFPLYTLLPHQAKKANLVFDVSYDSWFLFSRAWGVW